MASLSDYLKLTVWLDGEFVPAKSIEFKAVPDEPETLEHLAQLTYQSDARILINFDGPESVDAEVIGPGQLRLRGGFGYFSAEIEPDDP